MWLFTKQGHVSIGQNPFDLDQLVIHAQLREEIEAVVAMLDGAGGKRHEILEMTEEQYQFKVFAQRAVVAEAVARKVARSTTTGASTRSMSISGQSPDLSCG